jgi:outer membrane lipoprotein-sorting protein
MNSITRNMRMCALLGAALVVVVLSACSAAQPVEQAASSVESYLQARVAGNAEQMIALSCAAWESQARIEASSFQSMNAALDGVTCAVASSTASEALVHCTGRIVTSYNGESREWRMDERAFATAIEGGEWRMCGYRAK